MNIKFIMFTKSVLTYKQIKHSFHSFSCWISGILLRLLVIGIINFVFFRGCLVTIHFVDGFVITCVHNIILDCNT